MKIELKSNFTFKWFANVDVKFGMNVVNDHSWESYTPADHYNIIINEVDFPVDYPIFSHRGLITFSITLLTLSCECSVTDIKKMY